MLVVETYQRFSNHPHPTRKLVLGDLTGRLPILLDTPLRLALETTGVSSISDEIFNTSQRMISGLSIGRAARDRVTRVWAREQGNLLRRVLALHGL